ncbi:unnamed protein product [Cylicocyclus nassatus]|uniref:Uncharacterized protein n=1 Tax=Cylicocyclus nassatus TaxID=53992 RepID=A0AA36HE27_CYLNA|nr:unnamed protein product [Cylicocyclus nassatus]
MFTLSQLTKGLSSLASTSSQPAPSTPVQLPQSTPARSEETTRPSGQRGSTWPEFDFTWSEPEMRTEVTEQREHPPRVYIARCSRHELQQGEHRINPAAWLTEQMQEFSNVEQQPVRTERNVMPKPQQQPEILPNLTWWQPPKTTVVKEEVKKVEKEEPGCANVKPRQLAPWQIKLITEFQQNWERSLKAQAEADAAKVSQESQDSVKDLPIESRSLPQVSQPQITSEPKRRSPYGWQHGASWHANAPHQEQEPIQSMEFQQRGPNEEKQKIFFRWQPNVRNKIKPQMNSDGHLSIPTQLPGDHPNNWRPSTPVEAQQSIPVPEAWLPKTPNEMQEEFPTEWQPTGSNDWQQNGPGEFQQIQEAHDEMQLTEANDWQPKGDSAMHQNAFSGWLQDGPDGLQLKEIKEFVPKSVRNESAVASEYRYEEQVEQEGYQEQIEQGYQEQVAQGYQEHVEQGYQEQVEQRYQEQVEQVYQEQGEQRYQEQAEQVYQEVEQGYQEQVEQVYQEQIEQEAPVATEWQPPEQEASPREYLTQQLPDEFSPWYEEFIWPYALYHVDAFQELDDLAWAISQPSTWTHGTPWWQLKETNTFFKTHGRRPTWLEQMRIPWTQAPLPMLTEQEWPNLLTREPRRSLWPHLTDQRWLPPFGVPILLLHLLHCGDMRCIFRGRPHLHTNNACWLF